MRLWLAVVAMAAAIAACGGGSAPGTARESAAPE
jgi:hypothetical protein